ncbi:hypothetical protein [uncultured Roseobacter sp.]|uniref:hypothetical protein n=1 Tax=uncultured Roseobacter sp. TaxID=114847 RepID=UPI00260FBCB6|nr:hypothetical protein [uncultured Roseobacter sp.]
MKKTHVHSGMYAAVLSQAVGRAVLRWCAIILALVVWLFGMADISARADTVETQKLMFQFQNARTKKLVLHQPDLVAFLSGTGSGALNADITDHRGTLTFSSSVDRRLWARVNGRWGEDGQRKDKYGFGAMGLHAYVRPSLIVGGMIEADYLSQAGTASDKEGLGAMAGPYFLARNANHPLFFEGRFLYGRASNGVRLLGDSKERPETRRTLAQLKMSGQLRYGITTLIPSILASYATDDVSPRGGGSLPEQGIRLRQIKMRLGFRHTLRQMNGAPFTLNGGGALSSTSTRRYGSDALATPNQRDGHGRVNLGVSYFTQAGGAIVIDSFVDGLGASTSQNYGLKAAFNIRF